MISFEAVVYLLCFFSAAVCFYLLLYAYQWRRERLLLWSCLCFGFLALNNFLVFVDIILLPNVDLLPLRSATTLVAIVLLLYGFIWELE